MIRTRLFRRTFIALLITGFLAVSIDILHLYWTNWWIDSVVHFMAGVTVGMTVILVWNYYYKLIPRVPKSILIGLVWELYELYFGLETFLSGNQYYIDTVSDFLQDICGAVFGGLYAHRI